MKNGHNSDFGDLSDQIKLKKHLNCKSFEWYVENVHPQLKQRAIKFIDLYKSLDKQSEGYGRKYSRINTDDRLAIFTIYQIFVIDLTNMELVLQRTCAIVNQQIPSTQ